MQRGRFHYFEQRSPAEIHPPNDLLGRPVKLEDWEIELGEEENHDEGVIHYSWPPHPSRTRTGGASAAPSTSIPSADPSPQFRVHEDQSAQRSTEYITTYTHDSSNPDTDYDLYNLATLTAMAPQQPSSRFPPPPAPTSTSTATATANNPSRALFSQTLSRRPTSTATCNPFSAAAPTVQVRSDDASNDIIERDEHGNPTFSCVPSLRLEPMEDPKAQQKADNKLIEEYFRDCREKDRANGKEPPEEVKAALQRSLREKAASLDDDAWMFEGGDRPRRKLLF